MKTLSFSLLISLCVISAVAQSSAQFEVASVKRAANPRSGVSSNGFVQGDRFTASNATLTQLIRGAYGVQEFQISGQTGWFETERFDVEAKIGRDAKPADWQRMFQALLAERFKLMLHRGTKEVSIYALVIGKNGSKLKASDTSCDAPGPNGPCGFRAAPTEIIGTSVSMEQFATRLSRSLGRMVVDKTSLNGKFDFKLEWTADENIPLGPGASAGPAIFAAIQDQLGLRLESTRGPVETLFIDSAERPSEN